MRPTDLGFRSPKEKTPGPYQPVITFDGKELFDRPQRSLTPTFPKERRFPQYESEAQRTGMRVGPGSYNVDKPLPATPSAPAYKPFHGDIDTSHGGYIMVGNHLMYEPAFALQEYRAKSPIRDLDLPIDPYSALRNSIPHRPQTSKAKRDYEPYTPSSLSSRQDSSYRLTPEKIYGAYKKKATKTPFGGAELDRRIDHLLSLKGGFV